MLLIPSFSPSLRNGAGFQVVGTYTEGRRLEGCAQQSLLVVEIGPLVLTTGVAELARSQKTSRLSFTHVCCTVSLVFRVLSRFRGVVARKSGAKSRCGAGKWAAVGFVREVAGVDIARVMVI